MAGNPVDLGSLDLNALLQRMPNTLPAAMPDAASELESMRGQQSQDRVGLLRRMQQMAMQQASGAPADGAPSLAAMTTQNEQGQGATPQQANQKSRGLLKQILTRGMYGFSQSMIHSAGLPTDDELAMQRSKMNVESANADYLRTHAQVLQQNAAMSPVFDPTTNSLILNPDGTPLLRPQSEHKAILDARAKMYGADASAGARRYAADARKTAVDDLSNQYVQALQAGSPDAPKILDQIKGLTGAIKPSSGQSGTTKIDPIIYSYLGAPPDPATDPAGAKMWAAEAEKIKTRMAVAPRVAGYNALNMGRAVQGYDAATDTYKFATLGQAIHDDMMPANMAFKNMPKVAQFGEMQTASKSLRGAISNLDDDFSPTLRAKMQMAMSAPNESVLSNEVAAILGTENLTPKQQDVVIWMKQLQERALSLRNVAGMGQGAEDMRKAIISTLPNMKSANRNYALKQLDAFDQQVSSLYQGVGGKSQVPGVATKHMNAGKLPEAAAQRLSEGHVTTFANGQQWTLKNGEQTRLK